MPARKRAVHTVVRRYQEREARREAEEKEEEEEDEAERFKETSCTVRAYSAPLFARQAETNRGAGHLRRENSKARGQRTRIRQWLGKREGVPGRNERRPVR